MFIDEAQINVKAGDGGAGCVAFLREAHRPLGGPSGGDGGKGGDVLLEADSNLSTLLRFTRKIHFKASAGTHGQGKGMHGRGGNDLCVAVPCGTTIRLLDGTLLADLAVHGDRFFAAAGGRGGHGNARFRTRQRPAPSFAEQGAPGEEHWLALELRLFADVALVGFPNAGKSTLISAVSAARPKIADYPFTTLVPHLGVVLVHDEEIILADLPGLIEGAAEGKGLGHRFLRHIERARVLLILLDPCNLDISPADQQKALLSELERYQPDLLLRPRVVAVSKIETVLPPERDALRASMPDVLAFSSLTREGIASLLRRLAAHVESERVAAPKAQGFVVHRPAPAGVSVQRENSDWRVSGPAAERAVSLSDLTDPGAIEYLRGRLAKIGVYEMLADAGACAGDVVWIGTVAFEYEPEDHPSSGDKSKEDIDPAGPRPLAGGGRRRGQRSQAALHQRQQSDRYKGKRLR